MTISTINELLMQERQHRLEVAAERYRQVHPQPRPRRAPVRTGVGRLLVRTGLRLGHLDPTSPFPGRLASR